MFRLLVQKSENESLLMIEREIGRKALTRNWAMMLTKELILCSGGSCSLKSSEYINVFGVSNKNLPSDSHKPKSNPNK